MASSSTPSSSSHLIPSGSSFNSWNYQVYLSFKGEDTRNTFVGHLYTSLVQQGIHTCIDEEALARGEPIGPSLLKAIRESRIAVIVFSERSADSSWCLDELAYIMECRSTRGQIVMPVFYHVDPSDVRRQKGKYGEAFAKHELKNKQKVELWKNALAAAANLAGWVTKDYANGNEAKFIKHFVGSISSELYPINSQVSKDLIGIETRLQYTISPNGRLRASFKTWQKGKLLGSGSFGTVYEAKNEFGHFFAVKEVSLLDQSSQGKQSIVQLEQEISLLSQFDHENIVQYLGTDSDDDKLYIFLELVPKGSLSKLCQNKKYDLQDSQVSAYTRQILSGLHYLHEQKVVHRDIKCANILVDVSGSVKLADFGLAKATPLNDIKSFRGTPYWMAPEVANANSQAEEGYGLAADIWSLGCTVLEMLTRDIPDYGVKGFDAVFKIRSGERPKIPDTLSAEAQDFIDKCLQVKPNDRSTAAQLLEHPFLKRPTSMNLALPSPHHNSPQL